MQWKLKPRIGISIFGDWPTVISVRQYRDALIDQKPDDQDAADFGAYRLYFDSAKEVVAAFEAFSKAKLECEIVAACESPDRAISAFLATGCGYGHNELYAEIRVAESRINAKMADKLERVKKLLADECEASRTE